MKKLNSMRKSDFAKYHRLNHYSYKRMEVAIEWDYYNDRWNYGSPTHSVYGVFYGSVSDLIKHIKYEYNEQEQAVV